VTNDPTLIYWYRKSNDDGDDLVQDYGVELSPSLSRGNIYKRRNGHLAAFKYRFGLGDVSQKIHATYFMGIKQGVEFEQDGVNRRLQSMTFWGLSISVEQNLYKRFFASLNLRAARLSQNQAEAYFPNGESGSSWDTAASLLISFWASAAHTYSLGYQLHNESSAFNKLGTDLDIENESSSLFFSAKKNF
jgi:hypothetical protein